MSTFCLVFDKERLLVVSVNADLPGGELNLCELCDELLIFFMNFFVSISPLVQGSFNIIWK